MITRGQLDGFSRAFADALFAAFPEWEPCASHIPNVGDEALAMEVTIRQPGTGRTLSIRTDDAEIMITFEMWHDHLRMFSGHSESEVARLALDEIRDLLAERKVVKVDYRDGRWAGSDIVDSSEIPIPAPGVNTKIYSWLGTYDRNI